MRTLLVVLVCTFGIAGAQVAPGPPDVAEFRKKAEAGDVRAQVALARAYENGEGIAQNDALAVKWYRAAADQGDAQAQNDLGVMYRLGRGVEKDYAQARAWYVKAARQNYGAALFNLGTMYYNGEGCAPDDRLAFVWFSLAKEAGSDEGGAAVRRMLLELPAREQLAAMLQMADLFRTGSELKPDPARAVKLYETLGAQGSSVALIRAAKMYVSGEGIARDYARAQEHCQKAADRQFLPGMVCLGFMYQSGALGPNRSADAVKWFEKAVKAGNPIAMYSLGLMYAQGAGVKQDDLQAYTLFLMARRGDVGNAERVLPLLEKKLNAKQIEAAKQNAVERLVIKLRHRPEEGEFSLLLKME